MAEAKAVQQQLVDTKKRDISHEMLGAARYAGYLRGQASADIMRFLIMVRDEKRYLDYDGCHTFDEFLDSERSPMSRPTFYRKLDLWKKEGQLKFIFFEEIGLSPKIRGRLKPGAVVLDGEDAIVEGERISLHEGGYGVKKLVERLVKDAVAAQDGLVRAEKKIEQLQIFKGKYDELKVEAEAQTIKDPYMFAYSNLIEALKIYIEEVKDMSGPLGSLGGYEVAERAICDFPTIYILLEHLHDVAGEPMAWVRGSWNRQRHFSKEQIAKWPHFQSDAIDGDNF